MTNLTQIAGRNLNLAHKDLCVYFVFAWTVLPPAHPRSMIPVKFIRDSSSLRAAFSLIEMLVVIAILATLMTAGVSLLSGSGIQSRKAGTDMLSGLIEQARTRAITTRSYVVLAIAEPGDLPAQDERARVGIFTIDAWPDSTTSPLALNGTLSTRWQTLNTGIALIPGSIDDIANLIDPGSEVTITYGVAKNLNVRVHAMAFSPRGGLVYPNGSAPVALRIAEGRYRGGAAIPNERADSKAVTESRLKIGRVTGRPYQIN